MRTYQKVSMALGAMLLTTTGALAGLPGPAQAQDHLPNDPWIPNGESFIVSPTVAHLQDHAEGDTSIENFNPGLSVQTGDEISVEYELKGDATCKSGEPRIFAVIDGEQPGSSGNKSQQCDGTGQDDTTGTLSFESQDAGLVERLGVVYSNSTGHVLMKNLTVDGKLVLFGARCKHDAQMLASSEDCTPPTTPPATESPSPSPSPSVSPSVTPTTSQPPAGGSGGSGDGDKDLPLTGPSLPWFLGFGSILVGAGVGLYFLARRRYSFTTD